MQPAQDKTLRKTPRPVEDDDDVIEIKISQPVAKKAATIQSRLTFHGVKISKQLPLGDGKIDKSNITISCWNINGITAAHASDKLQKYLRSSDCEIMCFNETRMNLNKVIPEQVAERYFPGYYMFFNHSLVKQGYSGTAIATKYKPISVKNGIGIAKYDQEGRIINAEFEKFFLICVYVPNSGSGRLEYRVKEWEPAFHDYIETLKKTGKHVIVCGDFNVAHEEIDTHNPERYRNRSSGFMNVERESFSKLLKRGFIDAFRYLHPDKRQYTYWDYTRKAANKGWRFDYFLIDKEGIGTIRNFKTREEQIRGDHCPIELTLDPNFDILEV